MFTLIIIIVSVALVALLALATLFYGGEGLNKGSAKAQASQLSGQASQLTGAAEVHRAELNRWPDSIDELISRHYLAAAPDFRAVQWAQLVSEAPAFWVKHSTPKDACQAVNLLARGDDGIYLTAKPGLVLQCFGESEPYTTLASRQGEDFAGLSLSQLLAAAGDPALRFSAGADDWAQSPSKNSSFNAALGGSTGTPSGPVDVVAETAEGLRADALAYGTTTVGASAAQAFTLRNQGSASVTVGAPRVAAPFSVATNNCGELPAGASCSGSVSFSPTEEKVYNTNLVLPVNGSVVTVGLTGTGQIPAPPMLGVSAPEVDLSSAYAFRGTYRQVRLTNTSDVPVVFQSRPAVNNPDPQVVSWSQTDGSCAQVDTLAPGQFCDVVVRFVPVSDQVQASALNWALFWSSTKQSSAGIPLTGKGNNPQIAKPFAFTSIAGRDDAVMPSLANLWELAPYESSPLGPLVTSPSSELRMEVVSGLPAGMTFDATTAKLQGNLAGVPVGTYPVKLRRTMNGMFATDATFTWTVEAGTSAQARYSPASLTFGPVLEGAAPASQQAHVLTTLGTAPLPAYSFVIEGADADQFKLGTARFSDGTACTGYSVNANAQSSSACTMNGTGQPASFEDLQVGLSYAPTRTGSHQAMLRAVPFASAGPATVATTPIALTGTTVPVLQASPLTYSSVSGAADIAMPDLAGAFRLVTAATGGSLVPVPAADLAIEQVNGAPAGTTFNPATRKLEGALSAVQAGSYPVSVRAKYKGLSSVEASFNWTVAAAVPARATYIGTIGTPPRININAILGDAVTGSFTIRTAFGNTGLTGYNVAIEGQDATKFALTSVKFASGAPCSNGFAIAASGLSTSKPCGMTGSRPESDYTDLVVSFKATPSTVQNLFASIVVTAADGFGPVTLPATPITVVASVSQPIQSVGTTQMAVTQGLPFTSPDLLTYWGRRGTNEQAYPSEVSLAPVSALPAGIVFNSVTRKLEGNFQALAIGQYNLQFKGTHPPTGYSQDLWVVIYIVSPQIYSYKWSTSQASLTTPSALNFGTRAVNSSGTQTLYLRYVSGTTGYTNIAINVLGGDADQFRVTRIQKDVPTAPSNPADACVSGTYNCNFDPNGPGARSQLIVTVTHNPTRAGTHSARLYVYSPTSYSGIVLPEQLSISATATP